MTRPTARVLALLEALQSGGTRTVSDLAARLEVNERTVRRYIEHLKDLEVPVRSVRGRYGGYRLAPGFRMPPLMLTDEEALAVLLGLIAGRRSGLAAASAEATDSAAAKLRRVLPQALGRRLDALLQMADFTAPERAAVPPEARVLLLLAEAARHRQPVAITYTDRGGRPSERIVFPYGIVAHSGRWYVTGADSRSGEIRSFRLDRISAPAVRPGSFEVPDGFDPAEHVVSGIAQTPWTHSVSLRIKDTEPHLRTRLPAGIATVHEMPGLPAEEPGPPWLHVRLRAERLDWIPPVLASLDRPFVIEHPPPLHDLVRALAGRLNEYADGQTPATPLSVGKVLRPAGRGILPVFRPATRHEVKHAHRLSRFACRRAPRARVPARCFSLRGERRARSPVGSPVTAGPLRLVAGAAARPPGPRPCFAARAAASRSARSSVAAWRARVATRRLTRDRASSNASAFMAACLFSGRARPRPPCSGTAALAARRYWPTYLLRARLIRASSSMAASSSSAASPARSVSATSSRSASLRTASKDAFICLPRIPPEMFRRDQVFPDGRPAYQTEAGLGAGIDQQR